MRRTDMQIKKLALIGFSAFALTAYGTVFAGDDAAAKEKMEAQETADAAQKVADDRQEEAVEAVKEGAADAGAKVDSAAAAQGVAADKMKKAAE
jgi:hypothetical protein